MPKSRRLYATGMVAALLLCLSASTAFTQASSDTESVIIQSPKPYTKLVSNIQALGGKIRHQYKYVDAVAADIPSSAMNMFRTMIGSDAIVKDLIIPAPASDVYLRGAKTSVPTVNGRSTSAITDLPAVIAAAPAAYALNNFGLNLAGLHAAGKTGAGVTVAVIDSGVRPKYPALDSDNSVVGGADFVGDGFGFSNTKNEPHGTFVAGLISGKILINVKNTDLETSLQQHFPGSLFGSDVPLIGTAPSASIYAVRVFGANPLAGAPESRIIAAIDHVIDLRRKFLAGEAGGVNITVCNLSLGNTTLFAGRDVFDRSVDALLAAGIIPVVSAGDTGPAGLTVSSPATSLSAIAVGSSNPAANERVLEDIDDFLGFGERFRPNPSTIVSWFSGRGPNADGRSSPSVVATGVGNFGQGYAGLNDINLTSGTSFSAPLIAGVAAVLRQSYSESSVSAAQILNAIIASGNPGILGPRFTKFDQGSGIPDAQKAFDMAPASSPSLPAVFQPRSKVVTNVQEGAGLTVVSGPVTQATGSLAPGQRSEILYNVAPNTAQVVITVSNFASIPNPSPQNAFPEELLFEIHSAKTSQIGALGDYFNLGNEFIRSGTFTINNPEPGIMRITTSGSWTNEGNVSATVTANSFTETQPKFTTTGIIEHHQQVVFPVTIPKNVKVAEFVLGFRNDWSSYPTSDVDMVLFDPNLNRNTAGARLNAPERATVLNPAAGNWLVQIIGFDIPSGSDKYELRVTLDGKLVK